MQQDQNIKGFTLLELLVVVSLIAILSAPFLKYNSACFSLLIFPPRDIGINASFEIISRIKTRPDLKCLAIEELSKTIEGQRRITAAQVRLNIDAELRAPDQPEITTTADKDNQDEILGNEKSVIRHKLSYSHFF